MAFRNLNYSLEMERVSVDANGVQNFFWPVPIGSHKPMRDAAAKQFISGLRDLCADYSLANQAFFLLAHHLKLR